MVDLSDNVVGDILGGAVGVLTNNDPHLDEVEVYHSSKACLQSVVEYVRDAEKRKRVDDWLELDLSAGRHQ